MQIKRFSNGGYVAHKIYVDGMSTKFSAWFSANGAFPDVERFDRMQRSYPVKPHSKAWQHIAQVGHWWKDAAA